MRMNHAFVVFSVLAAFLALLGIAKTGASRTPANAADLPATPVIVELFTSEGCSSCPPADSLLKKLSEGMPIPGTEVIALEEHVDYWDHLGWKDPFSSSIFTERQNEYARRFGNNGTYTPQMVVDGKTELIGGRANEAREQIQKAAAQPKLTIQLSPATGNEASKTSFDIKTSDFSKLPNAKEVELWIAITEKNLHTDVKSGENTGERLQHAAVVRTIRKLDSFKGPADHSTHANINLDSSWQRSNVSVVAFAVDKSSRNIIGAASSPLAHPEPNR